MSTLSNAFNRKAFRHFYRNLSTKVNHPPPVPPESPESWQLRFLKYGCMTMATILSLYLFASAYKYQYLKDKDKTSIVSVDKSINKGSPSI